MAPLAAIDRATPWLTVEEVAHVSGESRRAGCPRLGDCVTVKDMRHQVHVFKRCHCPSPSKCKDAWYLGFRYKGRRYKESIPSHLDGHNPTTETEAFRAALTIRERLIGETPAESHADS